MNPQATPALEPTSPVQQNDWLINSGDHPQPQLGRVKDCYWSTRENGWLVDIILYSPDGQRIGRESPHCGGPGGFEPAVPLALWAQIEKPVFPLRRDESGYRCWRVGVKQIAPAGC